MTKGSSKAGTGSCSALLASFLLKIFSICLYLCLVSILARKHQQNITCCIDLTSKTDAGEYLHFNVS